MKMWKVAAVIGLLLAPAAFGAVELKVDKPEVMAAPGTSFTLTFALDATAGEDVYALSIYPKGLPANMAQVTARTPLSANLTDYATVISSTKKPFLGDGVPDLGALVADPTDTTVFDTGKADIVTYTMLVPATAPLGVFPFKWLGSYATFTHGNNDDAFQTPFTLITPEPMSALLLAVGAAFFARRRVA